MSGRRQCSPVGLESVINKKTACQPPSMRAGSSLSSRRGSRSRIGDCDGSLSGRAASIWRTNGEAGVGVTQMAVADVGSQLSFHHWRMCVATSVFKKKRNHEFRHEYFSPSPKVSSDTHSAPFTAKTERTES